MKIKLPFGKRGEKLIHIEEIKNIENGLNCNCVCPYCGSILVARLGEQNQKHFSHYKGSDCGKGLETALHLFAKQVIVENKKIRVPSYNYYDSYEDRYGEFDVKEISLMKENLIEFDRIQVEEYVNDFKPDIIAHKGKYKLAIEIAVTHEVDEEKKKKIIHSGLSTLEISLNIDDSSLILNKKELIEKVINSVDNKKWIYSKLAEQKKLEIKERKELKEKQYKEYLEKQQVLKNRRIEKLMLKKVEFEKIYYNKLLNNPEWIELKGKYNIDISNIPKLLTNSIDGEMAFEEHKFFWKLIIWDKFINNRYKKIIEICKVVAWIRKYSNMNVNKDLSYTSTLVKKEFPDITDAIYNFFEELTSNNILNLHEKAKKREEYEYKVNIDKFDIAVKLYYFNELNNGV
ncbi:MAG: competence protein CoiA [Clostridium sp.]|uniref:competence protein CoiA family protein n=1 Tax=Clostridium sp. TaxID=1506 RepID=UPI0025C460DF|nr:competence protein CoiA family protein [Clostridium sp.]MCE5221185.1 competence protein CoiA [Clostridium sp.]